MPSVTLTVLNKTDEENKIVSCVQASPAVLKVKQPKDMEIEVIAPQTNTRDIKLRWAGDELQKEKKLFSSTPANGVSLPPGGRVTFKLNAVKGTHTFGLITSPGSCDGHHHDIFHVEGDPPC